MTIINRQAIVPYTNLQMFALVDAIEEYPNFLPWCNTTHIIERNANEVKATLWLSKGGIKKSFSTLNRLHPGKRIEMQLLDGPFRHLEGAWQFHELDSNTCKVALNLEFEFSNKLIALALGGIFHHITDTMVDAFIKRAHEIYG